MKEISQYAQQQPALKHHLDTQVHEQNLLTDYKSIRGKILTNIS